jgi:hypothetical protein
LDRQYLDDTQDALRQPRIESIASNLRNLCSELRTSNSKRCINVFAPALARQADHAATRQALLGMLGRPCSPEAFLYQDIPYAYHALKEHGFNVSALEQELMDPHLDAVRIVIPLSNEDMTRKLTGIRCYASQLSALGSNLFDIVVAFSALQARHFEIDDPYCEVIYKLTGADLAPEA